VEYTGGARLEKKKAHCSEPREDPAFTSWGARGGDKMVFAMKEGRNETDDRAGEKGNKSGRSFTRSATGKTKGPPSIGNQHGTLTHVSSL